MENCLKRRDYEKGDDQKDTEDESDLDASLIAANKNGYHQYEYDSALISPYKRLRVEDFTHTSIVTQDGEGEAHSLLRSHGDVEDHSQDFSNSAIHTNDEPSASVIGTFRNMAPGNVTSAAGYTAQPQNSDGKVVRRPCHLRDNAAGDSSLSHDLDARSSIPYIDNVDPFICADEREFPPPPAFDKDKKWSPSSRSAEYDSSMLASYHPDFQILESRQISYLSDVDSPINRSSHQLNTSQQVISLSATTGLQGMNYSESINLLEIHSGDHSQPGNTLHHDKESFVSEQHHHSTIHHHATKQSPSTQLRTNTIVAVAVPNNVSKYIPHSASKSSDISKSKDGQFNASNCRSVVNSCMDVSPLMALSADRVISSQNPSRDSSRKGSTSDDLFPVYDTVASGPDVEEICRSGGPDDGGALLIKSTASLGVSTAELSLLRSQDSIKISRYTSQEDISTNCPSLGSSFESRAHGIRASSVDSIHEYSLQHHHCYYQQHLSLHRQQSLGSSKSHSCNSECQETHTSDGFGESLDLHVRGSKNVASSQVTQYLSSHPLTRGARVEFYDSGSQHQHSRHLQHHSWESLQQQQPRWKSSYHSRSSQSSQGSHDPDQKCLALSGDREKKAVLQSSGHLKISAYWNVGLLTVHVIQARCLSSSWKSHCDSYVKMSLVPDESRRTRCKSQLKVNTNNPVYDQKFSLEILEEDSKKRLLISVWHRDQGNGASEFLGCMSFGVQSMLTKDIDGWYYLLTEEIGRKKHLQAHTSWSKPGLTARSYQNIPQVNKAVEGQERIVITIPRGKHGFGFSFVDELPPRVGRVDRASPAERAGVKKGDLVVRINGQNVSRSTCEGVAHLVRKMNPQTLTLEVQRDHIITTSTNYRHLLHPAPYNKRGVGTSTDHLYESILEKTSGSLHKENRTMNHSCDEECLTDDDFAYSQHYGLTDHPGITSTPRPFLALTNKTNISQPSQTMSKHESIHRLMSLELDYIDFMHYGIERYSRPLRHCIVSAHQHLTIFQNVEKLVTISEYHIKQMQDNSSSINSDTDDSQSSESSMFPNSISLIYQSKMHMLSQAYESYANGLVRSNTLLKELRKSKDFINFIKEPATVDGQPLEHPSISAFINRPVLHIQELFAVLGDIFSATPLHSPDFATLQQIVIKLSQCVTAITELDSAGRIKSLDSLTSFQGQGSSQTSSGKGSMASLSSNCSSSDIDTQHPLMSSSATSVKSINKDVLQIQNRLVFPPHVQTFQLCQEGRHLIYQGDIYRCSHGAWSKSQLLLFSDILLIVDEDADRSLVVSEHPVSMQDLSGIEVNRKYASEFILHLHTTYTSSALASGQKSSLSTCSKSSSTSYRSIKSITLRAPTSQNKFMWKSLLEQRVSEISGSHLKHYGSMKDISNVKTSVIL